MLQSFVRSIVRTCNCVLITFVLRAHVRTRAELVGLRIAAGGLQQVGWPVATVCGQPHSLGHPPGV